MSSTNKTTNLELSQFLGSDSPKWLTDYNADMAKIDTAVGAVQSQADATDLVVSGHSTAIESLQTTTGEQGTAITSLRIDVNHNAGDISTINSLIGNGEPTTTDKTLIGAINELNANQQVIAGKIDTSPSFAHLWKEDVIASVTSDGTMTRKQMLDSLFAQFASAVANLDDNIFLHGTVLLDITGLVSAHGVIDILNKNSDLTGYVIRCTSFYSGSGTIVNELYEIASSGTQLTYTVASDSTVTYFNNDNTTVANGVTYALDVSYYKVEKTIS